MKVGKGTLNKIGNYLKTEGLEQIVIFLGNGLIDLFGERVMRSLKEQGITVLEYSELDTVDIDDIITLAFSMPNKTQAVVSIGGGKVIDAGKYAAFLRNKFIYSGIGDMISKITALYDWIYEEKCGYSEVNDFAVMIAKKAVNSFVRTPYENIKDEIFLKELVDSLAMSGIANEIAGRNCHVHYE